jgi:uroporphyrinogen decarboxylase
MAICKTPELCAEVSSLPVDVLGVDAAIIFADIMLPLEGMGIRFEIKDGIGPLIHVPTRDLKSVMSLQDFHPKADVPFVLDAIALTKKRLDKRVPLIGFAGAPFTIASYLIEGRPTRDFIKTKILMYRNPETWKSLMDKLVNAMSLYLRAQIDAGVDAVQLFDSWIGCLSPTDYHRFVLPYSRRLLDELKNSGVPRIHFGTGTASLLEEMKTAGGDVFSIDWRIPIDQAWQRLGDDVALQGNLDPVVLLADTNTIQTQTTDILKRTSGRRGHIFSLGHGMHPDTPTERVIDLVKFIHTNTSQPEHN